MRCSLKNLHDSIPKNFEFERNVGIVRRQNFSSTPLIEKYIHHLKARLNALDNQAPIPLQEPADQL